MRHDLLSLGAMWLVATSWACEQSNAVPQHADAGAGGSPAVPDRDAAADESHPLVTGGANGEAGHSVGTGGAPVIGSSGGAGPTGGAGVGGATGLAGTGAATATGGATGGATGLGGTGAVTATGGPPLTKVSFGGDRSYAVGVRYHERAPAVADLNGDGKPDLAVASFNGVTVLIGTSDGGFATGIEYVAGSSLTDAESAVAAGDLNGDGKSDLVLVGEGYLSVLLNRGDGTFLPSLEYDYAGETNSSGIAIGDLNGDGKPDLAAASRDFGSVSLLFNHGDGTFAAPVAIYCDGEVSSLALGDVNGDGKSDLVVASENAGGLTRAGVLVYLNGGAGSFASPVAYVTGTNAVSLAIGDLNGDGKLDLAFADPLAAFNLMMNMGAGTFGAPVGYPTGDVRFGPKPKLDVLSLPLVIAVGDLNGDGKLDLVAVDQTSSFVKTLMNTGDGTFVATDLARYGVSSPDSVALGDFNGDGKNDIVAPSSAGHLTLLTNDGQGAFAMKLPSTLPILGFPSALGDVNGDGKLDLVTPATVAVTGMAARTTVDVRLGNGDGTFVPTPVSYPVAPSSQVAVGDVNGDGKADLVALTTRGGSGPGASVLLNQGDGTFATPVPYPGVRPGPSTSLILTDLNGDGSLDLLQLDGASTFSVSLNPGDGTFASSTVYNVAYGVTAPGPGSAPLAIGDLNNDGKPDLVLVDESDSLLKVMLNQGDGTFGAAVGQSIGNALVFWVALTDLTGDGRADLIVGGGDNLSGTAIGVYRNTGMTPITFAPPVAYPGLFTNAAVLGDINRDGHVDVITSGEGNIGLFINNGDGTFAAAINYDGNGPVLLGDLTGDGKVDLVIGGGAGVLPNTSH